MLSGKREGPSGLGEILKKLRVERGWSLADLGTRCGITASTLSKVERGMLSLTYDRIVQLAAGLEVPVERLFGTIAASPEMSGVARRSLNRRDGRDTTKQVTTPNYEYCYLSTDLIGKHQNPIITTLTSRTIEEFGPKIAHEGEEFTYVLKGTVTFVYEFYAPATLHAGDSVYFDSSVPHAYLKGGDEDAVVLTVCSKVE